MGRYRVYRVVNREVWFTHDVLYLAFRRFDQILPRILHLPKSQNSQNAKNQLCQSENSSKIRIEITIIESEISLDSRKNCPTAEIGIIAIHDERFINLTISVLPFNWFQQQFLTQINNDDSSQVISMHPLKWAPYWVKIIQIVEVFIAIFFTHVWSRELIN